MKLLVSDIDGTLTTSNVISKDIALMLKKKVDDGWQVVLATGRYFLFALPLLKNFDFPYLLGLQNGALMISMPEKKVLFQRHIDRSIFKGIVSAFEKFSLELIVESGFENNDCVFFRKKKLSKEEIDYINFRKSLSQAKWLDCVSYDDLDLASIALIKGFGKKDVLNNLKNYLDENFSLQVSVVNDPFSQNAVMLINHNNASKKDLVQSIISDKKYADIVIMGNDLNDVEMLKIATYPVAVEGGPKEVLEVAKTILQAPLEKNVVSFLSKL
jgi:HAD superfamily hydrolase (TIGR01484 family)